MPRSVHAPVPEAFGLQQSFNLTSFISFVPLKRAARQPRQTLSYGRCTHANRVTAAPVAPLPAALEPLVRLPRHLVPAETDALLIEELAPEQALAPHVEASAVLNGTEAQRPQQLAWERQSKDLGCRTTFPSNRMVCSSQGRSHGFHPYLRFFLL